MDERLEVLCGILQEEVKGILELHESACDEGAPLIERIQNYMRCANNGKLFAGHVTKLIDCLKTK